MERGAHLRGNGTSPGLWLRGKVCTCRESIGGALAKSPNRSMPDAAAKTSLQSDIGICSDAGATIVVIRSLHL